MARWTNLLSLAATVVLAVLPACQPNAELESSPVGGRAFDSAELSCKSDAECNVGEVCGDGVCQMKRCSEANYASMSPLGTTGYFARDRELVIVEDDTTLQGYDPEDRSFSRVGSGSWRSATGSVVDVAGGNLLGRRPEAVAFVTDGSQALNVRAGSESRSLPVGFVPIAIAAGDVDADETDEVVAVSKDGSVAVCRVAQGKCDRVDATVPASAGAAQLEVLDVAVGDVDGDGAAEAILLTTRKSIIVVNFDSAKTGDTAVSEHPLDVDLVRVAAGDVDADGVDELVGVSDGWTGDGVHLYSLRGTLTPKEMVDTSNGAVDVAVGTFGARDRAEIALLRGDGTTEMFAVDAAGKIASQYTGLLSSSKTLRVAVADVDGDSPTRHLRGEPKLVSGAIEPLAVLTLPPYSRTHSDGRSSVSMGSSTTTGASKTDGVMLAVTATIGFAQEITVIANAFKAGVEARYTRIQIREKTVSDTLTKSASFALSAKPEMDGYDGGVVVLGCGCYHQYDYAIEDPAKKLGAGADGKMVALFVPVAAETSVWSTRRYNAMVAALGGKLPKVEIPYELGNVDSYPTKPVTLDKKVIAERDMVFVDPPQLRVSDVASTSFDLSVAHTEAKSEFTRDALGGTATIGAFGVTAGLSVDVGLSQQYSVSISKSSSFSGTVPALRNDPNTPEDELKLHGYSFSPILYRHHYTAADGKEAGSFFVLTYTVGR